MRAGLFSAFILVTTILVWLDRGDPLEHKPTLKPPDYHKYHEKQFTVINIVDGDTIDAILNLGFSVMIKERFRLARIDTPELKLEEREAGLKAKAFVELQLLGKEVFIKSLGRDKYGRWIAEIYVLHGEESINFNDELVEKGYAEYKDY